MYKSAFLVLEGHAALDRNLVPGYHTLLLRLVSGDIYSVPIYISTHYSAIYTVMLNLNPNTCLVSRETFGTIFLMVIGMTRPGANPNPTFREVDNLTTKPFLCDKAIQMDRRCH